MISFGKAAIPDGTVTVSPPPNAPKLSQYSRADDDSVLGWMDMSADAAYKEVKVEGKGKASKLTESVRCLNSILASSMEWHNMDMDLDDNFEVEPKPGPSPTFSSPNPNFEF